MNTFSWYLVFSGLFGLVMVYIANIIRHDTGDPLNPVLRLDSYVGYSLTNIIVFLLFLAWPILVLILLYQIILNPRFKGGDEL